MAAKSTPFRRFFRIDDSLVVWGLTSELDRRCHSKVHRWAVKRLPVLALAFRRRKRPVGASWRMGKLRKWRSTAKWTRKAADIGYPVFWTFAFLCF